MDITDIRRERLRLLITEYGGPLALARRIGQFGAAYLTQLAGPHPTRTVSEKFARKVEYALRLPPGWMDRTEPAPHQEAAGAPPAPVLGVADTVTAVLSQIQAAGLSLSPSQVAALVETACALGNGPELVDRLVRLAATLVAPKDR